MIKIKKSAVLQYFLIYLMLIIPGSCLFNKVLLGNVKYYILIALYGFLFIINKKYRKPYAVVFCSVLFLIVGFQRLISGGVGINAWLQFAVCILSVQFAIACDTENFLNRWIKMVIFFSVISIIFWSVFCIVPNIVNIWPARTFYTQSIGSKGWETVWHGKGVLLYSYLEIHSTRNCGIYTEPGVYQIVLNSALFILLFWRQKLHLKDFRQYKKYVLIIVTALITCTSTTGYIGMLLNLIFFFLIKSSRDITVKRIKKYVFWAVGIAIIVILMEYSINGTESILYKQIIIKLFGTSDVGKISLSEGSGQYRMGTILYSLDTVFKHPFGVGYDKFASMKSIYGDGLVAASLASFAAIYGIIPWIIVIFIIFYPVFKYEKRGKAILFILLFVNTTLAQTDLLYPSLMMIPIFLSNMKNSASINYIQRR